MDPDIITIVADHSNRLRLLAYALRGIAADPETARDSDKYGTIWDVSDELETAANRLNNVASQLCQKCMQQEIKEEPK